MKQKEQYTIGELAKDMDVSVRTLQYYDKEGLLTPSAKTQGGRRIYTAKDKVKLHQILSMKYLGFSLEEIKKNFMTLDTPEDVINALDRQASAVREQLEELSGALDAIEKLRAEVARMRTVDFEKYADIVTLLRLNNKHYWVLRAFDEKLNTHIRNRFENDSEKGEEILKLYMALCEKTAELQKTGKDPAGEEGQTVAAQWWSMVMDFTGGDMNLLPELEKFNDNRELWDEQMLQKQQQADVFIEKALGIYFLNNKFDLPEGFA